VNVFRVRDALPGYRAWRRDDPRRCPLVPSRRDQRGGGRIPRTVANGDHGTVPQVEPRPSRAGALARLQHAVASRPAVPGSVAAGRTPSKSWPDRRALTAGLTIPAGNPSVEGRPVVSCRAVPGSDVLTSLTAVLSAEAMERWVPSRRPRPRSNPADGMAAVPLGRGPVHGRDSENTLTLAFAAR